MKHLLAGLAAATILMPAAAMAAPKGKPGLWNITTTMEMAAMPKLPPEVMAMMKKRGMPGMGGEPVKSQICMTQQEISKDAMSQMQRQNGLTCTTRVISQSASSATSEITCHGTMEGTGRSQMSWRGDSHYDGSYNFKGTMRGQPHSVGTRYTGDWVKADCGSVKPFDPRSLNAKALPPKAMAH